MNNLVSKPTNQACSKVIIFDNFLAIKCNYVNVNANVPKLEQQTKQFYVELLSTKGLSDQHIKIRVQWGSKNGQSKNRNNLKTGP